MALQIEAYSVAAPGFGGWFIINKLILGLKIKKYFGEKIKEKKEKYISSIKYLALPVFESRFPLLLWSGWLCLTRVPVAI